MAIIRLQFGISPGPIDSKLVLQINQFMLLEVLKHLATLSPSSSPFNQSFMHSGFAHFYTYNRKSSQEIHTKSGKRCFMYQFSPRDHPLKVADGSMWHYVQKFKRKKKPRYQTKISIEFGKK